MYKKNQFLCAMSNYSIKTYDGIVHMFSISYYLNNFFFQMILFPLLGISNSYRQPYLLYLCCVIVVIRILFVWFESACWVVSVYTIIKLITGVCFSRFLFCLLSLHIWVRVLTNCLVFMFIYTLELNAIEWLRKEMAWNLNKVKISTSFKNKNKAM